MGLSFSHYCSSVSYGSFYEFIQDLAAEAGIPLSQMIGYGGTRSWDEINDPLVPLLIIQDEYGGGSLTPQQCLMVKRRIQVLADRWCETKVYRPHSWKGFAMRLAESMAMAAFLGERFEWY